MIKKVIKKHIAIESDTLKILDVHTCFCKNSLKT